MAMKKARQLYATWLSQIIRTTTLPNISCICKSGDPEVRGIHANVGCRYSIDAGALYILADDLKPGEVAIPV